MVAGFWARARRRQSSTGPADQPKNLRVGLITNDQSSGLVDTTMLRSNAFRPKRSPAAVLFRFNSLVEAASKLREDTHPDVS